MRITNTFTVSAPLQNVWDFFFDLERMGSCVPGVEHIEKVDETHYNGTIQVQVGPIRARFAGTVELSEVEPPHRLVGIIQARDRGTASLIDAKFESELTASDAHTCQVMYDVDLTVRGRLAQFGGAVIEETARQLTNAFAFCLQRQLYKERPPAEAAGAAGGNAEHPEDSKPSVSMVTIVAQAFLTVIRRRVAQIVRWQPWRRGRAGDPVANGK